MGYEDEECISCETPLDSYNCYCCAKCKGAVCETCVQPMCTVCKKEFDESPGNIYPLCTRCEETTECEDCSRAHELLGFNTFGQEWLCEDHLEEHRKSCNATSRMQKALELCDAELKEKMEWHDKLRKDCQTLQVKRNKILENIKQMRQAEDKKQQQGGVKAKAKKAAATNPKKRHICTHTA